MSDIKLHLLERARSLPDDENLDVGVRELLQDLGRLDNAEDQLEITFAVIDALQRIDAMHYTG